MSTLDRRAFLAAGAALAVAPALALASDPTPPAIRRLSPRLDRLVAPDAVVQTIASGIR